MTKFRIAQFNTLAQNCAKTHWFPYSSHYLPNNHPDVLIKGELDSFDSSLDWSTRSETLKTEMTSLHADIICLCEVDIPSFFEVEFKKEYDSRYCKRPNNRTDGCMIMWRKSEWEFIVGSDRIVIFEKTERIAFSLILRNIQSNATVRVCATHLFWDGTSPLQLEEADILVQFLTSTLSNESHPIILCGDMNSRRGSSTIAILSNILQEACEAGGLEYLECTSVVPTFWLKEGSKWKCIPGRRDEIDFVFVSKDRFKVNSVKAFRIPDDGNDLLTGEYSIDIDSEGNPFRTNQLQEGIPNRFHGSDHLPVVCDLELLQIE